MPKNITTVHTPGKVKGSVTPADRSVTPQGTGGSNQQNQNRPSQPPKTDR